MFWSLVTGPIDSTEKERRKPQTWRKNALAEQKPVCLRRKFRGSPHRSCKQPPIISRGWLASLIAFKHSCKFPSLCPTVAPLGSLPSCNAVTPAYAVRLGKGTPHTVKSGLSKTPPHGTCRTPLCWSSLPSLPVRETFWTRTVNSADHLGDSENSEMTTKKSFTHFLYLVCGSVTCCGLHDT